MKSLLYDSRFDLQTVFCDRVSGSREFVCVCVCVCHTHRVSQEECVRLQEDVPYGKVY
jgi:hypothetical protein